MLISLLNSFSPFQVPFFSCENYSILIILSYLFHCTCQLDFLYFFQLFSFYFQVISSALLTICNLTCPPGTVLIKPRQNIRPQLSISSSIPSCLPRKSDPSPLTFFQQAWREVRDAFGFKVLLHTLGTASGYLSGSQANLVRLLICQIVLGMASDPEIEEMFTTFPVSFF